MLFKRVLVALVLLPIGIAAINAGGAWFTAIIVLLLGLAAFEYVQLFRTGGMQPAGFFVVAGVVLLALARHTAGFDHDFWLLPLLVLSAMAVHLVAYERGRDQAATDFAITLGGIFYIGLLGSYFIALRKLPDGQWWLLATLPAVWLADSGAYFIGSSFGRHKLSPRLSPNKSWEGYLGGLLLAIVGTPALVTLYWKLGLSSTSLLTLEHAALLGAAMGILPTLGDLGESMIKRQMGVKDSGNLLPGHGGIFDRIDSWLWAAPLGYLIIRLIINIHLSQLGL
ncbi:MAG: phosphatidate cytidylyltransferase [Anaerolineae bacterium]|nr:phosphatidate cytidylyltransferase [Anaerolineae bacterium]